MPNLKVLSLNLHCLVEDNLLQKQHVIADTIYHKEIDIVFLQEVAQTETETLVLENIKQDNYAYILQQLLQEKGVTYHLQFIPIKRSFNQYDEGLALLSKYPLNLISDAQISKISDYNNWKRRKILVLHISELDVHLATTHFGWTDEIESFESQVDRAWEQLPHPQRWIMAGDFNVTPSSPEYQYLITKGCIDLFIGTAYEHHPTHIDDMDIHVKTSRIDYIMSNYPYTILDSDILFVSNRVSDHYGIYLEIKLD